METRPRVVNNFTWRSSARGPQSVSSIRLQTISTCVEPDGGFSSSIKHRFTPILLQTEASDFHQDRKQSTVKHGYQRLNVKQPHGSVNATDLTFRPKFNRVTLKMLI